ncbi:MAG TPA: ACP S-malonyltransferase [Steroidobacteraceae bacterium]|nr:ACP S-malonyltransferase [Steroidobacteraceae bacterium]
MTVAFVFPGQGSQSVGMLADFAGAFPVVRGCFEEASAALGYDLWQLCSQGPEAQLNSTEFTQPAMLCAGIAVWRAWDAQGGPAPDIVSGHSLGEFTALVCAGAMDFAAALRLVRFRGRAMQEAVPTGTGAMAAILGLEDAVVVDVCREAAAGEVVEAVNYNSPGQIVIAGHATAVTRAMALAKARGARRALPLPVSVPSHSSLMLGAAERLRVELDAVEVRAPRVPYLSAVDATLHSDPADIRATLVRQLASPVRWTATVQALVSGGASWLLECGPGAVLTGLNRRIEKREGLSCVALENTAALQSTVTACQGHDQGA